MHFVITLLIISFLAPIYTYFVYPLILMMFRPMRYRSDNAYRPTVSVLIAAYNEEKIIADKIRNCRELDYDTDKLEILLASDGSSDQTVTMAQGFPDYKTLKIFDLPRGGKVNAMNHLLAQAKGEVLIFSDANTMYSSNTIKELVKYFNDERIGCVSGQLRYNNVFTHDNGGKNETLYWKYENQVKKLESRMGRLIGANGAIYAVRRNLVSGIPSGIINDDFYISASILQQGHDVVMETEAVGFEEANEAFTSQFKRHVRDGAGHYQALLVFWRLMFFRKGSFTYFSHRVVKWMTPFFLLAFFALSPIAARVSSFWSFVWWAQAFLYLSYVLYFILFANSGRKVDAKSWVRFFRTCFKLYSISFYFFSVNTALLLGFVKFVTKRQKAIWETQR